MNIYFFQKNRCCLILLVSIIVNIIFTGCSNSQTIDTENENLPQIEYLCNTIEMPDKANAVVKYKYFDNKLYYSGYDPQNFGTEISFNVFNTKEKTFDKIQLNVDSMYYLNHLLSTEDTIYVESDTFCESVHEIEKFSRDTKEIIKSTEIRNVEQSEEMYFDQFGNICLLSSRNVLENNVLEIRRFTSDLEYIDLICLSDIFSDFNERYDCKVLVTNDLNIFCSQDSKGITHIDVCDKDFNFKYSSILSGIDKDIKNLYEAKDGNIILFSYDDTESEVNVDCIDIGNGNILEMNTITDIELEYICGTDSEYDFLFISNGALCGYNFEKSSTKLISYGKNIDCIDASKNNNEILMMASEYIDFRSTVYVTDLEGNLIKTYSVSSDENTDIFDFFPIKNGVIFYNQTDNVKHIKCIDDKKNQFDFEFSDEIDLEAYYTDSFGYSYVIEKNGDECKFIKISSSMEIENEFPIKIDCITGIYTDADNKVYLLYSKDETKKISILNLEDGSVNEIKQPDVNMELNNAAFVNGNEQYKFFITDYSVLYGYTGEEYKKIMDFKSVDVQILNNIDVMDDLSILCLGIRNEENYHGNKIYKLEETGSKNSKIIANIIAFGDCDENFNAEIKKYNSSSESVYLNVLNYEIDGWERLNSDIHQGLSPDMIVSRCYNIMEEFSEKNLALDLNKFINSNADYDYSIIDNVIDSCAQNGNLNYIYPSYKICGVFKQKENEEEPPDWTFNEFVDYLNNNIPTTQYENCIDELMLNNVYSNLYGYIDINGKCSFNNKMFSSYLDCLSSLKDKENSSENDYFEFLEYVDIGSFEEYNQQLYSCTEGERCLKKIPGINESSFLIKPDFMIGIFKNSEHIDESWKFAEYFLGEYYQNNVFENKISFPVTESAMKNCIEYSELNKSEIYKVIEGKEIKIPLITDKVVSEFSEIIKMTYKIKTDDTGIIRIIENEIENLSFESSEKISEELQNKVQTYIQEKK